MGKFWSIVHFAKLFKCTINYKDMKMEDNDILK